MELKQLKEKRSALAAEIKELANRESISAGEDARLTRLLAGLDRIDEQIKGAKDAIRASATDFARGVDSPTYWKQTTRSEVFSADTHDLRSKTDLARRAVDIVQEDTGREVRSEVAQHFAEPAFADRFRALSDPNYSTGLIKVLAFGEDRAHLRMTEAEKQAMARVADVEARTMSTTDSQGGYLLAAAIDPQILLNNTGTANGLRAVARVVTATTDVWRGIYSAGITSAWTPELTEVGDGSPTLGAQEITAHKAAAFVGPMSFEIMEDWSTMVEQLQALLASSRENLENEAFVNGDGTSKPYGILNRLAANTDADVVLSTAGTLGAVDIYNLMANLPPRFRRGASFMASLSVLNRIRAVSDDKLGNYITDLSGSYEFQLLGKRVYESSEFPAMVSGTQSGVVAAVGDFRQAYTIFDRLGAGRVSLIPHMFGTTNNRPIGASGLYYHWRVGGDVLTGSTSGECGARILVNKTS